MWVVDKGECAFSLVLPGQRMSRQGRQETSYKCTLELKLRELDN